ncbi:hypothetical protein sS8_5033 [Methylocaldum marinum]|uniref:Uncharacterized protein n=1 Tax=Methylocaldum marinum TaxID=1432792 RepID=A0A250KZL0_9GAMM|nr:hypothetical protein sS8_5033 [Methylocaldum marinum]
MLAWIVYTLNTPFSAFLHSNTIQVEVADRLTAFPPRHIMRLKGMIQPVGFPGVSAFFTPV